MWQEALQEGFRTVITYLEPVHFLLGIVPAFLISGAIASLLDKESILRFFGPGARKWMALGVASIAGAILAVCSCSILPMFASMYKVGAGIGPAASFLYSGPSINSAAVFISAAMLGRIGWARSLAAVILAFLIGLIMDLLYGIRRKNNGAAAEAPKSPIPWKGLLVIVLLVAMYFSGLTVYKVIMLGLALTAGLVFFDAEKRTGWFRESWSLLKMILPILVAGVFVASALRVLVPEQVIVQLFGTGDFLSNLLASVIGAVLYFGTLAEVPITRSLIAMGMAEGSAISFLLAGPALSLPNMIIINRIMGLKKGMTYILLVVLLSALAGTVL